MHYVALSHPAGFASAQQDVLWIGVILVLALVALGVFFKWAQKRWDPRRNKDSNYFGRMDMDQIEQLRRSGRISDEEFAAMRRVVMGMGPGEEKGSESSRLAGIIDDLDGEKPCADPPSAPEKDSK
jgi:hypothetical protein